MRDVGCRSVGGGVRDRHNETLNDDRKRLIQRSGNRVVAMTILVSRVFECSKVGFKSVVVAVLP
jgi:hypothetical protein